MSAVVEASPPWAPMREMPGLTLADLAERFGPMPLWRIRFDPWPGTATEEDVLAIYAREDRACELVDGILIEKTTVFRESILAALLIKIMGNFLDQNNDTSR